MQTGENQFSNYFNEVEKYSDVHLSDIHKFKKLLTNMKNTGEAGTSASLINNLNGIIDDFTAFKEKHHITLSESENSMISAAINSPKPLSEKKIILENLFHDIKLRYYKEMEEEKNRATKLSEIRELKHSKLHIIDWVKLTLFAMEYGTISTFTHNLKYNSLLIIRTKAREWLKYIIDGIQEIMNTQYYAFSILDYNALELFLQLKEPIDNICATEVRSTYKPKSISENIDSFARTYLTILLNTETVEKALRIIFKKKKPPRGFFEIIGDFLGNPPANKNRPFVSSHDKIKQSITGMLLSFYTSKEGVVVRTVNQMTYLLSIDGKIDTSEKHLTPRAKQIQEEKINRAEESGELATVKLEELERITEQYLPQGQQIEKLFYKMDDPINYAKWQKEISRRPMARIKKLVDGFTKYFVKPISGEVEFVLKYDNTVFTQFFENQRELNRAAIQYNMIELDLTGSRDKISESLEIPENTSSYTFMKNVMNENIPQSLLTHEIKAARPMLKKISSKSYDLAVCLNELINSYYRNKELTFSEAEKNFSFYVNAQVQRTKSIFLHPLLNTEDITLNIFLETACSLAYFISKELFHPGIEATHQELLNLKSEIIPASEEVSLDTIEVEVDSPVELSSDTAETATDKNLEVFNDPLTGLKKREFLEEYIIPRLYDHNKKYTGNLPRFVFYSALKSFRQYQVRYGHMVGDTLLKEISEIFIQKIHHKKAHREDVIIKYNNGVLIGYLNDISLVKAVDIMVSITREIEKCSLSRRADQPLIPHINTGIYEERKNSVLFENIAMARKIMLSAEVKGGFVVGFTKNPRQIISERDVSRSGIIHGDILSFLR